jgi:hypothetical protein
MLKSMRKAITCLVLSGAILGSACDCLADEFDSGFFPSFDQQSANMRQCLSICDNVSDLIEWRAKLGDSSNYRTVNSVVCSNPDARAPKHRLVCACGTLSTRKSGAVWKYKTETGESLELQNFSDDASYQLCHQQSVTIRSVANAASDGFFPQFERRTAGMRQCLSICDNDREMIAWRARLDADTYRRVNSVVCSNPDAKAPKHKLVCSCGTLFKGASGAVWSYRTEDGVKIPQSRFSDDDNYALCNEPEPPRAVAAHTVADDDWMKRLAESLLNYARGGPEPESFRYAR